MKKINRTFVVIMSVIISLIVILSGLQLCVKITHDSWSHWKPTYQKLDISKILDKDALTQEDYELLYAQTGLTKLGVDDLLQANRKDRILKIQDFYFKNVEVSCRWFAPYTYIEEMNDVGVYGALQEGDIIVSATTHSVFLRIGHAALVVEGDVVGNGATTVESISLGVPSQKTDAGSGANLANYMVLRPTGIPKEVRLQVAEYAKDELINLPYDLTVGIFSKKFSEIPKKTQCAHLCWYPYEKFGYDLDCNGGLIVKPQDIANSPYMEVVQIYGFDPKKLWK